jgi:hypothetical protein
MAAKPEKQDNVETNPQQTPIPSMDMRWIIVLTLYLGILGLINLWALIAFFPCEAGASCSKTIGFMFWNINLSEEQRMILLVIIAGGLGSLIHGFRSLFWYVGNRAFVKSWILMYFLLPFIGASLSTIFYFVLRGGLFSPSATVDSASPFGFIGVAGLVGLFSNRAALKLQEIAESIFSTKETTKGKNNVDNESISADEKEKEKEKKK